MTTPTGQVQLFLKEARERIPDVLALDAASAWEHIRGGQPLLRGLKMPWKREQVMQAAPRVLKAVAPLPFPLETATDRLHLIHHLLTLAPDSADMTLIAWLRRATSAELRLLHEQINHRYGEMNIAGYRAVAAEAARIGWPTLYKEDLTLDLDVLCTLGAPKEFWWGIRATGTDLFRPNTLEAVEWALAIQKHGGGSERLHYHFTGKTLRRIVLETMIVQLVHSLKSTAYEQCWRDAMAALPGAGEGRFRTPQEQLLSQQTAQAAFHAEEAYRRVVSLKQMYHY